MITERVEGKRSPLCDGRLQEKTATLPFVVGDTRAIVKGVAAEVCKDCGEAFWGGKVADGVTTLLQGVVGL